MHPFEFFEQLLPRAQVPYSHFRVAAVAIDTHGQFYGGVNQEYAATPLGFTVHAEQSAVMHALSKGVHSLAAIAVNQPPCGHCRQFLNELRDAERLTILLPGRPEMTLAELLPEDFGPQALGNALRLGDGMARAVTKHFSDAVAQAAYEASLQSYVPYTQVPAGCALLSRTGTIYRGWALENAAYNPTLSPLAMALNSLHLEGGTATAIADAAVYGPKDSGVVAGVQFLWTSLGISVPLRVISDHEEQI